MHPLAGCNYTVKEVSFQSMHPPRGATCVLDERLLISTHAPNRVQLSCNVAAGVIRKHGLLCTRQRHTSPLTRTPAYLTLTFRTAQFDFNRSNRSRTRM